MALVLDGDNGIVGVLATNADGDVIIDSNTFHVDAINNSVGIGTLTPTRKLHVNGSSRFDMAAGTVRISEQQSMVSVQGVNNAENAFADLKIDGSNVILNVQSGGNVGIGTTSPAEKVEVNGSFKVGNLKIQDANGGRIGFNRNTTNGDIYDSNFAAFQINGAYAGADFMAFEAYTSGGVGTDAMVIRDNGNVGIGTTNPTSKLHADGAIVSTNLAQGTGELQIQGYGNTGYINMNGSGSLIFRMGSSYSADLKLTSAGILQGVSDAEISTSPIRTHSNTISTSTTIDANDNAVASGPLAIADGVTLTINGNMTVV